MPQAEASQLQKRKMNLPMMCRGATVERVIDVEQRTVEISFSSEQPVERWFGLEILDHSPDAVRLDRIRQAGAAYLDHTQFIGRPIDVKIGPDRRGRAIIKFGRGALAEEVFRDVQDGVRINTSVMYRVHAMILESSDDTGDTYRATDWEPYEVGFVGIPADISVGVGRAAATPAQEFEVNVLYAPAMQSRGNQAPPTEETVMTQAATAPQPAAPAIDIRAVENAVREGELTRIRELEALGARYGNYGGLDLAREAIRTGKSTDELRRAIMERLPKAEDASMGVQMPSASVGMSEREIQRFSFVRAINALSNPTDTRAQKLAAFEFEASAAAAAVMKRESRGIFVPADVLKRDLNVTTTTAGGHTVATNLLSGSFIDMLRNATEVFQRALQLTDLNGNVAIPRQTGGATAYWVAESGAPTESQAVFDQVTLSPKTVGAFTDFSRKLMLQSSLDVEAFVRRDLATTLALEVDRACINGSGSSNEPYGILNTTGIGDVAGGTNGAAPTWAHVVNLESALANANAAINRLFYITNSKVRGKLKQTEKASSTAQFVWDGTDVNGYQALVTNQVPSTLTKGSAIAVCSAIIFANLADLIVGLWGGLDLMVDPYTGSTSGTVRVVALQDLDIAVRHALSFAAMKDALTT